MGYARLGVVELEGHLIGFETAVTSVGPCPLAKGLHFALGERGESLCDLKVLLEGNHVGEAGDGCGDRQRHGVAQQLLSGENAFLDGFGAATDGLHAEHRDAALFEYGKDFLLEAELVERPIEGVQRHLDSVEREARIEHGEVNFGVLVAGEAYEADLTFFFGFYKGFCSSARADEEVGVVCEADSVNLPEVDVIGLQPAQALFEHLSGECAVAAMRADLGHQEGLVTPSFEAFAEPVLGLAAAILPATVIKDDAAVQSRMDKFDCGLFVLGYTDMMSARTESRDLNIGLAETPERDTAFGFHIAPMHDRDHFVGTTAAAGLAS